MVHWLEKLGIRHITGSREPRFIFISGPCVIKDAHETEDIASAILEITESLGLPFVFKASFDKANRTRIKSYRGVGRKVGLAILHNIRESLKVPVLTDVHSVEDVEFASEVVDFLQIPAFLSRQTDLIVSAARTDKIINVKKGHFLSPYDMRHVIDKIKFAGNTKYLITERGTSFGYDNLVSDFRSIPIMGRYAPVLYDATHSVRFGDKLGRRFVSTLARAAIASGARGLYMEVHPEPAKSLSDGDVIFPLSRLKRLLEEAIELYKLALTFKD